MDGTVTENDPKATGDSPVLAGDFVVLINEWDKDNPGASYLDFLEDVQGHADHPQQCCKYARVAARISR